MQWNRHDEVNNYLRPYNVGYTSHEDSIATILLYSNSMQADNTGEDSENGEKKDFLTDLNSYVSTLTPEPSSINSESEQQDGRIPSLQDGNFVGLDGTNEYYGVFNNFSLQSVAENHQQIVKIHQNFSEHWNAFFFGESPSMFVFSGYFIDTKEYPYYQEFMTAYKRYMAGRKLIEKKMRMKILFDGRMIEGFLMSVSVNHTSDYTNMKNFRFNVISTKDGFIRNNIIYKGTPGTEDFRKIPIQNGMSNVSRLRRWITNGVLDTQSTTDGSGNNSSPIQASGGSFA